MNSRAFLYLRLPLASLRASLRVMTGAERWMERGPAAFLSVKPAVWGRWLGLLLGSCFSPAGRLLRWSLSGVLPADFGATPKAVMMGMLQLYALPSQILLGTLLPRLCLCVGASLLFLKGCELLGARLAVYCSATRTGNS